MMRLLCIGILTLGLFPFSGYSQSDSLEYNFYTLNDRYGVFELIDDLGDTIMIVGEVEITSDLDTVFFKELRDTVILESGSIGGVNTSSNHGQTTKDLYQVESNIITSKFRFLGGVHDLLTFNTVNYILNDSVVTTFEQGRVEDTLHRAEYIPRDYLIVSLQSESFSSRPFKIPTHGQAFTRRKNATGILDHIFITFDAYCSINPNNLILSDFVADEVLLGRRVYKLVLE